jgi:thiamine-phosphate pyrophosphorylase
VTRAGLQPGTRYLMLVSDRTRLGGRTMADLARAAGRAGVDLFQVREKDMGGRALLALVQQVMEAAAGTAVRVVVNGRADVAALAGAHGVHLPQDGLPVAEVRAAFPGLLVGVSCHDHGAVERVAGEGADYAVLGPVYATAGKDRPLGIAELARAVRAARVPVFAIGGIDGRTAGAAWDAGAHGVAAISVFHDRPVEQAVRALRGTDGPPA